MNTSADPRPALAKSIAFDHDSMAVSLLDGRTVSVPLAWFPRLLHASADERNHWELLGGGEGIHWPELDEDISVGNLLLGIPAVESKQRAAG